MGQKVEALLAPDVEALLGRRQRIDALLADRGEAPLEPAADDLARLETLLGDPAVQGDPALLQDLGAAFGAVLVAADSGLRWVMVEDELGRDPALIHEGTEALLFPLTMLSKRVERGEALDLDGLLEGILSVLREEERKRRP